MRHLIAVVKCLFDKMAKIGKFLRSLLFGWHLESVLRHIS
jgi:hypothetical protein